MTRTARLAIAMQRRRDSLRLFARTRCTVELDARTWISGRLLSQYVL